MLGDEVYVIGGSVRHQISFLMHIDGVWNVHQPHHSRPCIEPVRGLQPIIYRYRGREYVLASKTLGAKAPRLIFRHILPNAIGTIVTSSVLIIPSVIFNEATISYLGLGFQGMSSLGVILSRYQDTLRQFPYQLAVPAIIIALLMICFNLFGNGLRDAFNPSLKGTD